MTNRRIPSILLIEDDYDDIEIFNEALGSLTRDVLLTTAEDGVVALRILREQVCNPDLIFLDLKLPSEDGLTILSEIRKDTSLKHIPVVIFSALGNALISDKCRELGISDYVEKSADPNPLIETLKRCLNGVTI